jgi:hypothetical protein
LLLAKIQSQELTAATGNLICYALGIQRCSESSTMKPSSRLASIIALYALMQLPLVSHAFGSITGTYAVDNRPHELLFLTLTQSGHQLSGALTITAPDGKGSTAASVADVTGSIEGGNIDLKAGGLHLNGTQQVGAIVLTAPSTTGYRVTFRYKPTTEDDFNKLLTIWRQNLSMAHSAEAKDAAAQRAENDNIKALSRELTTDVGNVRDTGIPYELAQMETGTKEQKAALAQIQKDLEALKREAEVRPMTRYQACQTVQYAFRQTMTYSYINTLGYAVKTYREGRAKLEKRLANSPEIAAKLTRDADALQQALRLAKYTVQTNVASVDGARAELSKYRALGADAQARIPILQATVDNLIAEAKALMEEGNVIATEVSQRANCR